MAGSVDPTFVIGSGFDNSVACTAVQGDGKILVGGSFTTYKGVAVSAYIVRLNPDGSLDPTFNVGGIGFNSSVSRIIILPNGKLIVSGFFSTYNGVTCPTALVRLNPTGSFDPTFNVGGTGFNGWVGFCLRQPDGKILTVGFFQTYNGITCPQHFHRVNADGSYDSTWNIGPSGSPRGFTFVPLFIALQSTGKIIVGGFTDFYNGGPNPYRLIRVNSDGSYDSTFNVGFSGFNFVCYSVAIQPDDKIVAAGGFTVYNGAGPQCLTRIQADGHLDTTFNNGGSGFNSAATSIILQPDGKMIVGGVFTTYNGVTCPARLVRINTDGSLDRTFNGGSGTRGFNSGANPSNLNLLNNGKIIVGGGFTSYTDDSVHLRNNIVRITAYNVNKFLGESFSNKVSTKISSFAASNTLELPLTFNPGQKPGSISIGPDGASLIIRKPGGALGSVTIT